MTTFYICRHGQTENNKNERLSGWIDTPLTDEGVRNAASAAAKLKGIAFDEIIASDLGRAFITAYLVTRQLGTALEIHRTAGLREVNYGELANAPLDAYPAVTPEENTDFVPEGGESLAQMQRRVLECITGIAGANPGKTILLVAHDGTINAINASFTGQAIGIVDANSANAHDFVAKFVVENDKITSFEPIVAY